MSREWKKRERMANLRNLGRFGMAKYRVGRGRGKKCWRVR
jgi:hypothetical protein